MTNNRNMNSVRVTLVSLAALATALHATEFHVAVAGKDSDEGTRNAPFGTIQHAADLAQPGDVITVHEGTYRERINPPRGGESDTKRIIYQAAPGEKVVITGSEPVKGWARVTNDTWKVVLPNRLFDTFNPYAEKVHGDWFNPLGREHHRGCVYLGNDALGEAEKLEDVTQPATGNALWFATAGQTDTTIWAQFKGVDPNEANVEINVRPTVFTPEKTNIDYLTVRGFELRNAATNWAAPTSGQQGLISISTKVGPVRKWPASNFMPHSMWSSRATTSINVARSAGCGSIGWRREHRSLATCSMTMRATTSLRK